MEHMERTHRWDDAPCLENEIAPARMRDMLNPGGSGISVRWKYLESMYLLCQQQSFGGKREVPSSTWRDFGKGDNPQYSKARHRINGPSTSVEVSPDRSAP